MMNKKKVIQYILRIIIFSVISLVLGLTIYTINAKKVTGKQLVMPFDKTICVVLTGSMEPTISVNDLLIVEKTNDYVVGDIVVYESGNSLVVHRIMEINGDTVITAGDKNYAQDGSLDKPIKMSAISGEVVGTIPVLGLIFKMIKSPIGIFVILTLSVILLVLSYRKEKEENNKEIDSLKEELDKLKKEIEEKE